MSYDGVRSRSEKHGFTHKQGIPVPRSSKCSWSWVSDGFVQGDIRDRVVHNFSREK